MTAAKISRSRRPAKKTHIILVFFPFPGNRPFLIWPLMKPYLFLICLGPVIVMAQSRYDVIIDELMVDPSPQIGLPNNEWIELKNVSVTSINLQNWRLANGTAQTGPLPYFILQPDSFVIVCGTSALNNMNPFGNALAVTGFPSLNNDRDQLLVKSPGGMTIHAIDYSSTWYENPLKQEGGWSLEMIDTKNPCGSSNNWKASNDALGGSPGKRNSVDANNVDQNPPSLKRTYTMDAYTIIAVFDEPVDSSSGSITNNFFINHGLAIANAAALAPLFNTVKLTLNDSLQQLKVYELSVSNIKDCKNNFLTIEKSKAGRPSELNALDMVINEILFNPRSNAEDYVEFLNKSNKILDASGMYIANRNSSNVVSNIRQLAISSWLIFPGDHVVTTADEVGLAREYLVVHPDYVLGITSPPSMPDDKGFVILLNQQGHIIDEVNYNSDWHFKLLSNVEGVALERIDPFGLSQLSSNWHSASSSAGFGTPTAKNSQYKIIDSAIASIDVVPKIFSPDNNGADDVATIQYRLLEPGFVANVTIFDAAGRPARNLVRNDLVGLKGYWNWDGLGDKGQPLTAGPYIILTELFNLNGKKYKYRKVVILARKI